MHNKLVVISSFHVVLDARAWFMGRQPG